MMKTKLIIVLALFFVLGLEGIVMAEAAKTSPAFTADGVGVSQRRKRRRVRRYRKARVYPIQVPPEPTPMAPAPEPVPEAAAPPVQEAPMVGGAPAPPPPASDSGMDSPGRGRPMKRGPRIKPPTTRIKPPTR